MNAENVQLKSLDGKKFCEMWVMHAINGGGNAWIKIIGVSDQYASKRNQNHDGKRWERL